MQQPGSEYCVSNVRYSMTDENVTFSMDIQKAYPEEARVRYYNRTYRMYRGKNMAKKLNGNINDEAYIEITDAYAFEKEGNTLSLNFMVWKKPEMINDGITADGFIKVEINANTSFCMQFNKGNTKVDVEHCDTGDARLRQVWGNQGIYRIIMTRTVPKEGSFSIRIYKDCR